MQVSISKSQTELVQALQQRVNNAQRELDLVCTAVLAGHELKGRVTSLDTDTQTLSVEVEG